MIARSLERSTHPAHPPVKLGVLGTGFIGAMHLRNAAQSESIDLVAVAGARGTDSARRAVEELFVPADGPAVRTFAELLADPEVEAVLLATRTSEHAGQAVEILNAGKHLLMEKPGAINLTEHHRIQAAAQAQPDLVVRVAYHRRHDPRFDQLGDLVAAGAVGQPIAVHTVSREDFPPDDGDRYSGGFIMDLGVHDFDTARWLLGEDPQTAYALGHAPVYTEAGTDNAYVTIGFPGGAATTDLSRTAAVGMDIRCEVVGTEGTALLRATALHAGLTVFTKADAERFPDDCRDTFPDAYRKELADFAASVRGIDAPGATLADDRWAVAVAVAARASAERGEALAVGTDW
jgi:predicted dehydrogenase